MGKISDILKALSDETRLRILNILYEKELCVCDIKESLKISQAKASRHLIYMKNAGLIKDRKSAQWTYYSLVSGEDMKFIDSLVFDDLRKMQPYKNDLQDLKDWLEHKKIKCE